jgi:hypothetical protein
MENCAEDFARRETANNLPTDKTQCNEAVSKYKETQVHIENMVWLGYAYLYTGLISQARSRTVHDAQYDGGWFEYLSPILDCYPVPAYGTRYKCKGPSCGCFACNKYMGAVGWQEVPLSQVPAGTPLVDGCIHTYKLELYEPPVSTSQWQ